MLDLMRKYSKAWFTKAGLGFIALVFVSWGGYAYTHRRENSVAMVGERYITTQEYGRAYENVLDRYRQQFGKSFSDDLIRSLNLKQQVLSSLINHYVMLSAAEDLGLTATTGEIRSRIREVTGGKFDLPNGKFDMVGYETFLRQNKLTLEMFEEQLRQELTVAKVQDFVKGAASVAEDEILAEYHFNNDRVKIAYVLVDPKSFEDKVALDDNALQAFHKANQNRYMEPEKRKVSYIYFKTDDFGKELNVTEDDARRYYEDFQSQYHKDEEVRARHILFSVKPDASESAVEKVKGEAQKILDEIRKGKDFAELAKKHSADPGSAQNGGDLGFFSRKKMVPGFSEAAFALKPGEVSDLVRTQFGFHIIKAEEAHPERTTPFEEVKADIETTLKQQKAQDLAQNKARDLRDLAYARKDIEKAASSQTLQLTGAEVWIEQKPDPATSEALPPPIKTKLFALSEGELSDVLEAPKGIVVAQVKEIKAPQPIPYEQVQDKVKGDYRTDQAKVLARNKADELLKLAKEKKSLDAAAKDEKLALKESDWFSRKEPDKEVRLLRAEEFTKIFELQESEPFPGTPLELGGRVMVCQLRGRQAADQPDDKAKPEITERLLQQKQTALWQSWVDAQRGRSKVEILQQL